MIIVGVDPGQVTGVAWWDTETEAFTVTAQSPADGAVINLWLWLERFDREGHEVEVACEQFVIGPRTLRATRQYDALHVAGALKFKCTQFSVPYHEYRASDTKRLVNDQVLRQCGGYTSSDHVNDAERVALTHLANVLPKQFHAARRG